MAKQLDDPWWGATGTRVNRISRETVEKTGENHGLNLNPTLGGFMGFNVSIGLRVSRPEMFRECQNEQLGTFESRKRGASGGICGALGDRG